MSCEDLQTKTAHRGEDRTEEISKKDLLRQTGISYGQFYRWKRMGLIPESWFHRRSTFTGQETFLPRRKLLDRIQRIQELKQRYSLEEIVLMLSPDVVVRSYSLAEVELTGWISPRAWALFSAHTPQSPLRFLDLLCLRMIEQLLAEGEVTDEQIILAAKTLLGRFDELDNSADDRYLVVVTCGGATAVLLHTGTCLFGEAAEVVASVSLNPLIAEVKVHLRDLVE